MTLYHHALRSLAWRRHYPSDDASVSFPHFGMAMTASRA
jgi:hypothetical protein